jgi:GH15 family glucan-1,4-alpha-glucosidase
MTAEARPRHAAALEPADDGVYPPIGDYALIGDCRTAALVSRAGAIEWLCLPHFSGPSVFAAVLDRERGGSFAIRPAQPFRTERRYVGASAVLETTFVAESGRLRVTDFMPIIAGTEMDRHIEPERAVMRIVEGLEGTVDLEVKASPRPDYGRAPVRLEDRGRIGWTCSARSRALILQSDVPLAADRDRGTLTGRCRIAAGEKRYLTLTFAGHDIAALLPPGAETERRLATTLAWWDAWSRACSFWQVDHLARCRKLEEATRTFEDLLGYANDVGLYAEEIDLRTGAAVGNFPQAFTHVGLIAAALGLDAAERGLGEEYMG